MNNETAVLNPPADMPKHESEPVRIVASKPTPGPYRTVTKRGGEPMVVREGQPDEFLSYGVQIYADKLHIGDVDSYRHTDPAHDHDKSAPFEEVAANAHLFAASWDLLKAAEKALAVFGKCPFFQEEFDAALALKDAIAKAYGQGGE